MEHQLPTYEAATARDPLPVIARYVRHQDLLSACLVSRHWNKVFSEVMWECPERLWEMGERTALTGFLLFLRSISQLLEASRRNTAFHTQSISLAAVRSSIYTNLPAKWLHLLLSNLSNLRHLDFSTFNHFDHSCLVYFSQQIPSPLCTYSLRSIVVQGCENLTPQALASFFKVGWPELLHLNLSKSKGVNHSSVLQVVSSGHFLPSLKILALRDLKLEDQAVYLLAKGLGTRLEKLDITSNLITDKTIEHLLDWCVLPPEYTTVVPPTNTRPFRVSSAIQQELERQKGLVNLSIGQNPHITIDGLIKLLRTTNLEVLDYGVLLPNATRNLPQRSIKEALLPVLSVYAHGKLRILRSDYRLICSNTAHDSSKVAGQSPEIRFKAQNLPKLETLILCGVPYFTRNRSIVSDLIVLLQDLAAAEAEAELEAIQCEASVVSPNERKNEPRFLKTLVLEMKPLAADGDAGGNEDSEEGEDDRPFDEMLRGDFTFFADKEEEGLGGDWRVKATSGSLMDEIESKKSGGTFDILSELETFIDGARTAKMRDSLQSSRVWPGKVKVVKSVGWDDGGVEFGSSGTDGWGIVHERL